MFFRRRRMPEDAATESLNMTPMIDVVFQLLIFFMLSMHFKEVEGKLLSQLPKTGGLDPSNAPVLLQELRVVICAGGDAERHIHDKGAHERVTKNGDVCAVLVEKRPVGEVHKSETYPAKATGNKAVYAALGARAKEVYGPYPRLDESGRPVPVIIDADSEVPYEHIIGAVNACKNVGIDNVEFVGNPRHDKYYGSYQRGQFQRTGR